MAHDTSGMVAVASGPSIQVKRWRELLQRASIDFVFAGSFSRIHNNDTDHRELWVLSNDADRARFVIIGSEGETGLMW